MYAAAKMHFTIWPQARALTRPVKGITKTLRMTTSRVVKRDRTTTVVRELLMMVTQNDRFPLCGDPFKERIYAIKSLFFKIHQDLYLAIHSLGTAVLQERANA